MSVELPERDGDGYLVSMDDWTQIAGHWNNTMSQNMMAYAGHPQNIAAEEARIRGGGPPKQIQVSRGAPGPDAGQNVVQPAPAGMANPAMQQAAQANAAIANNPLGFAAGQAAAAVGIGDAINAGAQVHVRWADGNSYAGTVSLEATPTAVCYVPGHDYVAAVNNLGTCYFVDPHNLAIVESVQVGSPVGDIEYCAHEDKLYCL